MGTGDGQEVALFSLSFRSRVQLLGGAEKRLADDVAFLSLLSSLSHPSTSRPIAIYYISCEL